MEEGPVDNPSRARERMEDDCGWLFPPRDVHDSQGWDRYWNDQISHGLNPQIFDMFSDDRGLIAHITSRGFRSVLCAGNGISQEPRALATAGFEVTAIDLSLAATLLAQAVQPGPDYLSMFGDAASWRPGGTVKYVTADLLDAVECPGPFDVIIERRTEAACAAGSRSRVVVSRAGLDDPAGRFGRGAP
jgi:hypothetical protein